MAGKDSLVGRFLGNAEKFNDKQIADTLALLVTHGFKHGASDIHIEPHERFVLVRYRIDGVLRGVHKLPRPALDSVVAQLKKMANLRTQETAMPQEGAYETLVDTHSLTVRVYTMPVYGGEKVVLHLVVHPGAPVTLESLGFWGTGLHTLQQVLASPHGLVLVAGPRHSGRSSTIFSMLSQLNSPLVSIATVEQHPKHRLPGVSHTYLTSGTMSIADGVRAAFNQDPNVVMVSDMPDGATANQAVHAATTGHLVIVGMHGDGAAAAALRLRAAGVEPFLLVTALRASVGQRLVRALCPFCRQRYALSPEEQARLAHSFGIQTAAAQARVRTLERAAADAGIGNTRHLGSTASRITHLWRRSPEGCEHCSHTGYRGRAAITEVLASSDALHAGLLAAEIPTVAGLQKMVLKDGFTPMALDGLIKALRGLTTPADVLHAVTAS